jgi:hypothetical protein
MVNLDIPVKVNVNGNELINEIFIYDPETISEEFERTYDRKSIWVNKIHVTLK